MFTENYLPKCVDIGLLTVGVEVFILMDFRVWAKLSHNLRSKIIELCARGKGTTMTTLPGGGEGGGMWRGIMRR